MLSDQDKLFAQYAIRKGFINKQILNHYLLQKNTSTLQNYLQEKKLLTIEQIAIVHREIQSSTCSITIERYIILQKIGQGGMGCVYKVQDKQLQRIVALKTVSPKSNYGIQRFLREARTMASLKHPNILNVIDLGVDNRGQPYFTMEYINGKTLKERSLSTRKIIAIMVEVCKAIQYAHQQGIIHRDLKPSNIMLDGHKPIVMDFGLAKINHSDKKLSKSGEVIGTLQYMPPEQALGRGSDIDHRSDIYALGAILFYLLTGAPPFTGSSINVIFQITQEKVKFSTNVKKRIPQQLQNICLKAMAKEKNDRYQSADELAHDLNSFLQGKEVEAHKQKQLVLVKQFSFAALCIFLIAGWIFFAKSKTVINQQSDIVEILAPKELKTNNSLYVKSKSLTLHLHVKTNLALSLWLENKLSFSLPKNEKQTKVNIDLQQGLNNIELKIKYQEKWETLKSINVFHDIHIENPSVFRSDLSRSGVYSLSVTDNHVENKKSAIGATSPLNIVDNILYYGNYDQQKKIPNLIIQNSDLTLKSQYSLASPISSFPLVIGNFIYFGTKDGYFYCLDMRNNFPKICWKSKLANTARFDSPIFYQGFIYVSDHVNCYALDMYTGKKMWELNGQEMTSPTIFQEIMYIGDANTLYALTPKNGQQLWHIKTTVSCTPVIGKNRIFYHSKNKAHCCDLQGNLLWSISSLSSFTTQKLFAHSPIFHENTVYWLLRCRTKSGVNFSEIHAMHDEKLEWHTVIPNVVSHAPILMQHDQQSLIFVANTTSHIFVLDSKSGKQVFHYQTVPKKVTYEVFPPVIYGQSIYIPSPYKMEKKNFFTFSRKYQTAEIDDLSIEGEHFQEARVEDMSYWGSWSNGQQLFWPNKSSTKTINFHFIAPQEGEYNIHAYFTLNKHYGKHKVAINYQFTPPFDLYTNKNGYHRSPPCYLGTFNLRKGKNVFTVSYVGQNIKRRRFGLDNIILKPTKKESSHLIAYFPFDKDNKDHSIFQNEVQGNVPITPGGIKDNCASFHGKNSLILKEKVSIRQKFTFCVWLYHENLPNISPILSKFSPNKQSSYRFTLSSQIPTLQLWCSSQNTLSPLQLHVPSKKWYMLAVTYNGTKAKFYLDGKWKSSINLHGKIAESLNDLHIGFTDDHPTPFTFQGKMDELRIYNRVLTAKEIADLYK